MDKFTEIKQRLDGIQLSLDHAKNPGDYADIVGENHQWAIETIKSLMGDLIHIEKGTAHCAMCGEMRTEVVETPEGPYSKCTSCDHTWVSARQEAEHTKRYIQKLKDANKILVDKLKWVWQYINMYCVFLWPKKTTEGVEPDQHIMNNIDQALKEAEEMVK